MDSAFSIAKKVGSSSAGPIIAGGATLGGLIGYQEHLNTKRQDKANAIADHNGQPRKVAQKIDVFGSAAKAMGGSTNIIIGGNQENSSESTKIVELEEETKGLRNENRSLLQENKDLRKDIKNPIIVGKTGLVETSSSRHHEQIRSVGPSQDSLPIKNGEDSSSSEEKSPSYSPKNIWEDLD